jgi:DNA-binding beta-propeller fold protein YncE
VSERSTNGTARLEAIASATCTARDPSCAVRAAVPLPPGAGGAEVALDPVAQSVYVAGSDAISVVDARHCNAADMSGCATQSPATIPLADAFGLAVGAGTLYAAHFPPADAPVPGSVAVIATRHCRAGDTSACAGQRPPEIAVGDNPLTLVVDRAHQTLYVLDNGFSVAGRLSLIDISHCDGADTRGCAQAPPTTPTFRAPLDATLDGSTDTLYITDFGNANVSLIDTARCNAARRSGCPAVPPQVVVGGGPWGVALDTTTRTVFVSAFYGGTVSRLRARGLGG